MQGGAAGLREQVELVGLADVDEEPRAAGQADVEDVLEAAGFAVFAMVEYEADDAVGAAARRAAEDPRVEQVLEGTLGIWDTTRIPDGVYLDAGVHVPPDLFADGPRVRLERGSVNSDAGTPDQGPVD